MLLHTDGKFKQKFEVSRIFFLNDRKPFNSRPKRQFLVTTTRILRKNANSQKFFLYSPFAPPRATYPNDLELNPSTWPTKERRQTKCTYAHCFSETVHSHSHKDRSFVQQVNAKPPMTYSAWSRDCAVLSVLSYANMSKRRNLSSR